MKGCLYIIFLLLFAFCTSSTITCQKGKDCYLEAKTEYAQNLPSAQKGTCLIMGDPHYSTFDGNYYNFMGNCTYIIAKNCHVDSDHPAFEITTKNERNGNTQETVVSEVTVEVYGTTITFNRYENGLVQINHILWNLPISLSNGLVKLKPSGFLVTMETDFGLSVQYDWDQFLAVTVPDSFMARMCGMCGNFNGNKDDDLTTPTGSLAGSIPALGKSWRVPGLPGDAYCRDECAGQCQSCEGASWFQRMNAKLYCSIVTDLMNGPLRDCRSVIDSSTFYDNCLYSYCAGKNLKDFLCYTTKMYINACERAGIKVYNWRDVLTCPVPKCPAHSHFESCACAATCENPTPSADCKTNCLEACVCNDGYLWSGNKCVPKTQCGCMYSTGNEKRYLQAGESIWADDTCSKQCTCNPTNGQVTCENTSCPSGTVCSIAKGIRGCHAVSQGTCSIYGDPHYNTFDDATYTFQGTCTYTAAKGCHLEGTKLTPFAVIVENEKWNGIQLAPNVSMAKVVVVEVYGMTLVLRRNQDHQIMINSVLTNIPVSLDNGAVTVQQEGFQNVILTDFGLRVAYDMVYHVSITVPSSYHGKTCGLCGNFNGNKNDEFLLPDGKETNDIKTFGAAWKVAVAGVVCDDGCSGDFCPKCPADKKLVFEKDCSIITDPQGPFAACHQVIHPDSYFMDCAYDVCMGDGDSHMLCHSIAAYMMDCQDFGVSLKNWRTPTFCPVKCPANSHYEVCAQSCDTPCPGLDEIVKCNVQICAEGCMCDSGFFNNGTGCIKADQCGCYEDGHTYKIGESVITDDCQERLTCLSSGEVKHQNIKCNSDEACQVQNGVRGCYTKQCLWKTGGSFKGESYLQAGESIWADDTCTTKCTCSPTNGQVVCENASCPSGTVCSIAKGIRGCHAVSQGTCNIYGDPHYNTFDNTTYTFQGTCTYTAAQGCNLEGTQLTPFAVIVENEKWNEIQLAPNVSVAKVVVVEVYNMTLVLRSNQLHQIMINSVLTNIPVSLDNGAVTVQQEGFQNVILTDFGLRVAYDMVYHVSITVPSSYHGKTCGLCGNFNGNKNDEFLLPDGKETKDIKTFGAAWKVAVPGVVCDDGCSGDFCPKCPADKKLVFEKDCSIITDPQGPFAACHQVIHPDSYFRDCAYDVCMGDGDSHMLCHSIAAYMIDCQDFGVSVKNWRTPTFCPVKCPANSHYEVCAQSCDTPCPGLDEIVKCNVQICAEGCMCDSGFFNNGTGCIKADQCSCYEDGHTYKIGESVITDDCQERLTCLSSGEVKHQNIKCNSDETCQVQNGVRGCYTKQCLLKTGGSFTLFNGESWIITSEGAYELVKVCDGALVSEWFRVVVDLEACGNNNNVAFVYVFFDDLMISVNSKQTTWVNGKPVPLPQGLKNGITVQWSDGLVIIEKISGLKVSYSLSQGVTVTVNGDMADNVCGACGSDTKPFTVSQNMQKYMASWKALDFGGLC